MTVCLYVYGRSVVDLGFVVDPYQYHSKSILVPFVSVGDEKFMSILGEPELNLKF